MKIGMVIQSYYPVLYGGGVHAHAIAEGLRARGHEVKMITTNFRGQPSDFPLDESQIIRVGRAMLVPSNGSFSYLTVKRHMAETLQAICDSEKFDLLHIHSPLDPSLPLVACNVRNVKKVGTFHSYVESDHWYKIFRSYLGRRFAKLDVRIAVSQAAVDFLSQYFQSSFHIIPNGIHLNEFRPDLPKMKKFDDGVFNFLFVGRFEPRKGARYLLQAFNRVASLRKNCRMILVGGEGMLRHYYARFVDDIYKDRVVFEGSVRNGNLPPYYASADACCFPAVQNEAFGIVILEAMASGKPVIASRIRGYGDLVNDHEDGILVEPRDPADLAAAMLRIMDDVELRDRLSANALRKAQGFDWQRVVELTEACYHRLLNEETPLYENIQTAPIQKSSRPYHRTPA